MKISHTLHALLLLFVAVGTLYGLSRVPWSDLTDNKIKDFDLLGDLFPPETISQPISGLPTESAPANNFEISHIESTGAEENSEPTASAAKTVQTASPERPSAPVSDDGVVLVENYSDSPEAFPHFREALSHSGDRLVRIAFVGDSFIEGDIFSQDLRSKLQEDYGGAGVGYLALHTDMAGFRQSVRQTDSGWEKQALKNLSSRDTLRLLQAEYSVAESSAKATFKGSKKPAHADQWNNSSFLFIAPSSGTLQLTGSDGLSTEYQIIPSENPQFLTLPGLTREFTVKSDIPGLIGLGVYLDDETGVQVDCMSIRGNSGLNHRSTNVELCHRIAPWVDYDLIILEFGTNAVSAEQTNYSSYAKGMAHTVERVKACYPDADILLLGISDRGAKSGTEVKSLESCSYMVDAQRSLAQRTGVHFWDTRAAMGGADAIVDWRKRKLMNADYIHLNHAGGAELATLLYNSLKKSLDE